MPSKKIELTSEGHQNQEFSKALFRLFHTKHPEDSNKPAFSKRQSYKLSQGLFFGQRAPASSNDLEECKAQLVPVTEQPEAIAVQRAHARLQASVIALQPVTDNEPDKTNTFALNRQRALKYYYKLLYLQRRSVFTKEFGENFHKFLYVNFSTKIVENTAKDRLVVLRFQTLLYKHAALHAAGIKVAAESERAMLQDAYQAQLENVLEPLAELGTEQSYEVAKQCYHLLSCREFDSNEQALLLDHVKAIVDAYCTCQTKSNTKSAYRTAVDNLQLHFQALYQDLPMTVDPEKGIQGILKSCHDFFDHIVKFFDTPWVKWGLLGVPAVLNLLLFKPCRQAFAMFKRVPNERQPHKVIEKLIPLVLEDANSGEQQDQLKWVVRKENFWRANGYISAVTSAIGCGVVTAVAVAALGGVPFLWASITGVLISGIVANYYLHKAYVPNTWVRFMEKGLFKGLNTGQLIATWGGVVLALLASLAICAITYVDMNYALLQVGSHLGWFALGGTKLTFALAATPWLVTPMGWLLLGLLAVSLFIAFETFITNFPLYVKDYTDFIREKKWNGLFNFFRNFFGYSEQSKTKRVGTILYNCFLVGLVVSMTLSLIYFAMLPTSIAFGLSTVAILGAQWTYHAIVWGNMVANMPFVFQNIVNFCLRTAEFIKSIAMFAHEMMDQAKRTSFRKAITWNNIMQMVREIAGIKEKASTSQVAMGAVVFVGLVIVLFAMVIFNAFGNGKVGQEGGDFLADSAPLHLSEQMAENLVVGTSSLMSYLFCYQAIFTNEKEYAPLMMDGTNLAQRMQYNQLLQKCVANKTEEPVNENEFCEDMNYLIEAAPAG